MPSATHPIRAVLCWFLAKGLAQNLPSSGYSSSLDLDSGPDLDTSLDTSGPGLPNPLPNLISSLLSQSEPEDAAAVRAYNRHASSSDTSTLRFLSVVTRHGSRSPTYSYPNDPYPWQNSSFWPDGPGQLTRFGKQQLYASGQALRMRYNGFLNLNYFPNDNSIRANRYDRDFMSAACLLAGLYPPVAYQVWNPVILWQPIPIWEEPFDVADIAERNDLCPKYKAEQKRALDAVNKHSSRYSKLLNYLSKHTGMKVDKITDVVKIWDVLQLQVENGFKLPQWTRAVFPNKMARLYAVSFATIIAGTPKMISLVAGPILKMISHQMMEKAQGTMDPNRLIFIEAAHDTTLQALLSGLGFEDPFPIETSAFMVFELHESSSAGLTVQVLYYNSSAHTTPNILDPPNCPNPCLLSQFTKFANTLAPSDWDAECVTDVDPDKNSVSFK